MRNIPFITLCLFGVIINPLTAKEPPVLATDPKALAMAIENLSEKARLALDRLEIRHGIKGRVVAQKSNSGFRNFNYYPEISIGDYLDDIQSAIGRSERNVTRSPSVVVVKDGVVFFGEGSTGAGGSQPIVKTSLVFAISTNESKREYSVVSGRDYYRWSSVEKSAKARLHYTEATYRSLILTMLQGAGLLTAKEAEQSSW